jgi:hypothetical protein
MSFDRHDARLVTTRVKLTGATDLRRGKIAIVQMRADASSITAITLSVAD